MCGAAASIGRPIADGLVGAISELTALLTCVVANISVAGPGIISVVGLSIKPLSEISSGGCSTHEIGNLAGDEAFAGNSRTNTRSLLRNGRFLVLGV